MKTYSYLLGLLLCEASWAEWRTGGSISPYYQKLGIDSSTVTQNEKSGFSFNLSLDNKMEDNWKFKSDFFFRTDFIARDRVENFQFIPENLYLQKRSGSITAKFGFQKLSLDGPDLLNPADIAEAKNWVDPTSPVAMSSAGLSLSQEVDEWNWVLFYIPFQTTPVLPGAHSPWLPRENRLPIESEDTELRIPDNARYEYQRPDTFNDSLRNNVVFKLQNKSEHLETQFLYYNGLAQSPFLTTQVSGTLVSVNPDIIEVDSPVKLTPLYYRQQALAFTFNLPFESWALHGGANYLNPTGHDQRLPRETTLYTLGLEKSFETSLGMVTGIVDYVRQESLDKNQISFLRSIFTEAVVFGARIPLGEETQVYAGGLYDLKGQSSVYKFNLDHRLSNSWKVEAGGQLLLGPKATLIGLYRQYDSYQLKLSYSW